MSNKRLDWYYSDSQTLSFSVNLMSASWYQKSGIYIFAGFSGGRWRAFYVGQTIDFSQRLTPSHSEWKKAARLGATHVHASSVDVSMLDSYEKAFIRYLAPPLNEQHRRTALSY